MRHLFSATLRQVFSATVRHPISGCKYKVPGMLRFRRLEAAKIANVTSLSAGGRRHKTYSKPPAESQKPDILPNQPLSIRSLQFVLWAYAGSGFVSLAYEVVWARLISLYTVGAVYSISIMLVVYLSGLVIGSLVGSWSMRRWKASLQVFGLLEMGVGLLAIGGLFIFNQLANLAMEDVSSQYSIEAEMAFEGVLSAITLLPVTILIGALYPIVSSLYTSEQRQTVGQKVSLLNALNTTGSISDLC